MEAPAAGWYRHPNSVKLGDFDTINTGKLAYWDGAAWSPSARQSPPPTGRPFIIATPRARFVAWVVDTVLVLSAGVAVAQHLLVSLGVGWGEAFEFDVAVAVFPRLGIAALFLSLLYSSAGWSPGRALLGIRTINSFGKSPGLFSGFIRTIFTLVAGSTVLILAFALLRPFWSPTRQTGMDSVVGTYVVSVRPPR